MLREKGAQERPTLCLTNIMFSEHNDAVISTKFVNREQELALLDEEFVKSKVLVLFGRRRVGKTELIKRWGINHEVLYSQAIEADESIQLNQVYEDVRELLPIDVYPQSWRDLLKL